MYMLTIQIKRADPGGGAWLADCRPPQNARDALRSAEEALDRAWSVEILDLGTGKVISFSQLRKAAAIDEAR